MTVNFLMTFNCVDKMTELLASLNNCNMPFNENIAECFAYESEPVLNLFSSLNWY